VPGRALVPGALAFGARCLSSTRPTTEGDFLIAFIVGTTAELIKIAPVFHEIRATGADPHIWFTAQHTAEVPDTLADLGLPAPHRWLASPTDVGLEAPGQVPGWAWGIARRTVRNRAEMREELSANGRPALVVVHGDTFTTLYGSIIGRLLGARVAHVEAGTRSGSLLSPLPEEANRRLAARLVDLHFAPTEREVHNLRRSSGVVVNTEANTVIDAIRLAMERQAEPSEGERVGLITLHRFELLQRPEKFTEILTALRRRADDLPLVYLAGGPERERIGQLGLGHLFDDRFRLRPKARYLEFLPMLARAELVVTDSGGLQEECAYLGVPCAIYRERTERHQGLGENIVLTGMQVSALGAFLDNYESHRRPSALEQFHPSRKIAETLGALGYC
jgi:UDP-N-acetylglucosamine 2-epimerase (non-hydrolysing)